MNRELMISLIKNSNESDNNLVGAQIVEVFPAGKVAYLFFRPTPFCSDGYRDKMDEELEKKGWQIGMGGATYKEGVSPKEFLNCLAFGEAYREIYKENIPRPLANIELSVSEFLNLVDERNTKLGEKYERKYPEVDKNKIISILREDFEFSLE